MKMWSLVGLLLATTSASAHNQWSNGKPIPDWVKQVCCANNEGHQIDARQVHPVMGSDPMTHQRQLLGYRIEGMYNLVPIDRRFDSEDGLTWIFYSVPGTDYEFVSDLRPYVHCLFTNEGS
jgi:hypothetical protein